MKRTISLLAIGFVAGCSGGGSSDKAYVPLDGTGSAELASSVAGASAEIDLDANTLTYNGEVGQINTAGDTVTFASGDVMSLSGLDNEYSRLFALSGANPTIGTYGVDTAVRDLPRGSASYDGDTLLVVTAPEGIFDLAGDVTADVNFGSRFATVELDNLSGTRTTGLADPDSISDFGTVQITGISLNGNGLDGGVTEVTTDETSIFDDTATGGVSGLFYGPNGEEVGGNIDVVGEGGALTGGFIAKQ